MGKKSRIKRERKAKGEALPNAFWEDAEGIHTSLPADRVLPPGAADLMTNRSFRGTGWGGQVCRWIWVRG
jgi:hypothetical protein